MLTKFGIHHSFESCAQQYKDTSQTQTSLETDHPSMLHLLKDLVNSSVSFLTLDENV